MPDARPDTAVPDEEVEEGEKLHRVEAVLGARFPGINKKLKDFNFQRHYGAEVKEIKTRNGQRFVTNLEDIVLHKERIPELSAQSIEYVAKYHDHVKVARQYLDFWE